MNASFLRTHLLLIPGALALAAVLASSTGIDHALSAVFYDAATNGFPAHASATLEMLGHRFAKTAAIMVWMTLLLVAVSTSLWPRWSPRLAAKHKALWAAVVGMAAGPMIVIVLKGLNSYRCPRDLREFGGAAEYANNWFVSAAEAGHCFPGGHAASGFCLVALYFLGRELEDSGFARLALSLALLAGIGFGLIRVAQGANFLSHNLWAAAICWLSAALAFLPLHIRPRA